MDHWSLVIHIFQLYHLQSSDLSLDDLVANQIPGKQIPSKKQIPYKDTNMLEILR